MRYFVLGIAAAAAVLCGPAAAQYGTTPYQTGFTTSVTPLGELSGDSLQWMVKQTQRQATVPSTSLAEIDTAIDKAVGPDLEAVAGHHHFTKTDMALAMRYEIVFKAREMVLDNIRLLKKSFAQTKSDDDRLALQDMTLRRMQLDTLVDQSKKGLTRAAKTIVVD